MQTPTVEYAPFSRKQLEVLQWWIDPRLYDYPEINQAIVEHPELLNRTDKESIICDGSIRAGKTLIMSMSYVMWSMTNYNHQQFGIAGKTIGSLRRNVIRPLKSMLEARNYHVKDNRAENLLTITNGDVTNYYFLFGGKDEGSQDLVQGITVAGFFFDEVALMPESFVNQATARASVDGAKLWFNCNPSGPYHWFKLEWIDQLEKHKAVHIHFMMEDNPSLSEMVKDRYRRQYSGVFYQRFILGRWVLSDGIVYDNFNRDQMVVEPPDPHQFSQYVVSCDYGALNPTVFLLWGLYQNTWYCLKEYYYNARAQDTEFQKSDNQYADDLGQFLAQYSDDQGRFVGPINAPVILDPSAVHFAIILQQRGYEVIPANNDVLDGIRLTQTVMNNGAIRFAPHLDNLFKEFASYIWDDKAAQRGEDKVVKDHDHAMDAMRYFCMNVLAPNQDDSGMQLFDNY